MISENSLAVASTDTSDNSPTLCRGDDKASLPREARLPINRCNLPAVVLGLALCSVVWWRYRGEDLSGVQRFRAGEIARFALVALPAIALPVLSDAIDRSLSLAAGMDDFLAKPVSLQTIGRALDAWTQNRK